MSRTKLLVGLGNPGPTYEHTRHNIGFRVADLCSVLWQGNFVAEKKWSALVSKVPQGFILKPQTYMNLSGTSAAPFARFHKIEAENIIAVYDDVDLPFGTMKLKPHGSAGGHNGVSSLIEHLGTNAFPRLRLGVAGIDGRPAGDRLSDHVLGKFSELESEALPAFLKQAAQAVSLWWQEGLAAAMNATNRKPTPTSPA